MEASGGTQPEPRGANADGQASRATKKLVNRFELDTAILENIYDYGSSAPTYWGRRSQARAK
jgi:hypothetical protein